MFKNEKESTIKIKRSYLFVQVWYLQLTPKWYKLSVRCWLQALYSRLERLILLKRLLSLDSRLEGLFELELLSGGFVHPPLAVGIVLHSKSFFLAQ